MSRILWRPDPEEVKRSQMFRFLTSVNESFSLDLEDYGQLHAWSVAHLETFWDYFRTQSGIRFTREPEAILSSRTMPGARWFEGAQLNYAANLLRAADAKTAILSKVEGRELRRMTFGELRRQAAAFAGGLQAAGVQPGDCVAGFMPNLPETVTAMLGAASIGAAWTSCSPDFGPRAVQDRLGQVSPKVLVTVPAYRYNGRRFDLAETLKSLCALTPGLKRVVGLPFPEPEADFPPLPNVEFTSWEAFMASGADSPPAFRSLPFNHPLFILFSSGTTGLPKGIVHGAGGTLLQHAKEHALHTGIGDADVVFYYTTCGWMMWNWLVSALAQGAAIVLYEGSPGHPDLTTLWRLIDEAGITVFGASPKFLSQNLKSGIRPREFCSLNSLRAVLSTGSPLDKADFHFVYREVKRDVMLSSISGGTDIVSCFFLGNPMLPVREEEIQCIGLGMDVQALDSGGRPVFNQKGELACLSPAPCMPLRFWDDPGDAKYRKAYFDKTPGVWVHGDYVEIRDHGGVVVYGRSDATLNPGGVRIGTAEVYRVVEGLDEVADSLVVGVRENQDVTVLLFVTLKEGRKLDPDLVQKLRVTLRREASPRHVPQEIYQVKEIPKTLNGKKMELTVRDLLEGKTELNTAALADPGCLDEFRKIRPTRPEAAAP